MRSKALAPECVTPMRPDQFRKIKHEQAGKRRSRSRKGNLCRATVDERHRRDHAAVTATSEHALAVRSLAVSKPSSLRQIQRCPVRAGAGVGVPAEGISAGPVSAGRIDAPCRGTGFARGGYPTGGSPPEPPAARRPLAPGYGCWSRPSLRPLNSERLPRDRLTPGVVRQFRLAGQHVAL